MHQEPEALDLFQDQIHRLEEKVLERSGTTATIRLIETLPGVAKTLVIEREIGIIDRFRHQKHLANYSGTWPKVTASGGKFRYGKMRKQSNQYRKWAFTEIVQHSSA